MSRLRIAPEAEAEVTAAALWYESKRLGLGVEHVAAVDEALERIAQRPLAWPFWARRRPFRRCVVKRFPLDVFFTACADAITVFAVAHARRRPGYWLDR